MRVSKISASKTQVVDRESVPRLRVSLAFCNQQYSWTILHLARRTSASEIPDPRGKRWLPSTGHDGNTCRV